MEMGNFVDQGEILQIDSLLLVFIIFDSGFENSSSCPPWKELSPSLRTENGGWVQYLVEKSKIDAWNVNKPRILPSILYCSVPKYKT